MRKTLREVSEKRSAAILAKRITLNQCPKCGFGDGEIRISMPWYGIVGARVVCNHCGYETMYHSVHDTFTCCSKIFTPITDKALVNGIRAALEDWNKYEEEHNGKQ